MSRSHIEVVALVMIAICSGCNQQAPPAPSNQYALPPSNAAYNNPYDVGTGAIEFKDTVTSQTAPATDFAAVPLSLQAGGTSTLGEMAAGRNLVVVFARGYSGAICPYCSTQTAGLISNYEELKKRNAEVVVIYPLEAEKDAPHRAEFLAKVNALNAATKDQEPPFPFVLDVGLKAVDLLGIRKDLSKPATFILDAQGAVRFAYVGESLADRPSVKAILGQLDQLQLAPSPM
jgi:peroxiredoxin